MAAQAGAARLVMALSSMAAPAAVHAQWIEIDASRPFIDRDGGPRTPSCSGGPELTRSPKGAESSR